MQDEAASDMLKRSFWSRKMPEYPPIPQPAGAPHSPPPSEEVTPGSEALRGLQTEVVAPSESECLAMLAEETQFADSPDVRAAALKLLSAGYSVRFAAIRLGIRPTTIWHWSGDPEIRAAIESGKRLRAEKLGQGLEEAAFHAVQALNDVVSDDSVNPKDRIKAAEVVLDRTGLDLKQDRTNQVAVSVDIDFDERLARIVAGSRGE